MNELITPNVRIFSYGGGIQSFTTLLMQTRGDLEKPFDLYIFANVGNDSEKETTLRHIHEIAMPLAEEHNIAFKTVQKIRRGGTPDTLYREITADNRSVRFPAYMSGGAPGRRACTVDFKVRPIQKSIKAVWGGQHVELGIGFSTDEAYRVAKKPEGWHTQGDASHPLGFTQRYAFPLIDHAMSRTDCHAYIERAGFAVPPKSACWFCPFTGRVEWIEMRRHDPQLFARCVDLESRINEKRVLMGRDAVYLHSSAKPLNQAVGEQAGLFEEFYDADNECQTGYCGL